MRIKGIMKLMKPFLPFLLATLAFAQGPNKATLPQPTERDPQLYPSAADARTDIKAALAQAVKEKKNVILDFGAVWCYDCHVLDLAFKDAQIRSLLQANYVVVHIDVGRYDKNTDVAKEFKVPLEKGIPALAILNPAGKLLTSNKHGEFQAARKMTFENLSDFLNKWKPKTPKPKKS